MISNSYLLLIASTVSFIAAASAAKSWALSANSWALLVLTLGLYTVGNLIMLRLIRDMGMGVALSVSGLVQLIAVNLVAVAIFGERLTLLQTTGLIMGLTSMALIMWPR
jgi:multidrug transporter EmrE-like cation transporter